MNVAPVSMNNYSNRVSFEGGKKKIAPQTTGKIVSEQTKKPIKDIVSKCWSATKEHLHKNRDTYIPMTFMLTATAGLLLLSYSMNKKIENAQNYIEQTDYDRYIDMCVKDARGKETVGWVKTANRLKDSIATVNAERKLQEDSLRIYNKGVQDGLKQVRQEALKAGENN